MNFFRSLPATKNITKRSLGWLAKNKRIDEYGGIRESTYRDYVLTPKEMFYHVVFLFLPASFIYYGIRWTFDRKLRLMGISKS